MIKKRERFWTILLVSAIISATVSFFTTSFGLLYYISFLLAIPLALAVQMGLFGLAWLIGFGNNQIRPLIIGLYFVAMIFSVTFSFVFLQSELVEKVKPRETQRQLFDDIRIKTTFFGGILNEGINESEILVTRLANWLEMEEKRGWATKICDEEDHCYLQNVCRRVRTKIDQWEKNFRKPYHQGPGRELIHGALEEEYNALEKIKIRLTEFRDNTWLTSPVLSENLSNRERLTALDQLVAGIPKSDLESVLCREIALPISPDYEDFARDNVIREEKQVYAFDDLRKIFKRDHKLTRSDYPTIFALGLSIFIDLFVLIVAIGAALVDYRREDIPIKKSEKLPSEQEPVVRENISGWVNAALLGQAVDEEMRNQFIRDVIKAIRFVRSGQNVLVPRSEEQFRLGVILVKAKAAFASRTKIDKKKTDVFILEDWVYLALMRYLNRTDKDTKNSVSE
ncbi:MAG: hypothetical protein JXB26_12050 [Candidatus Aminicenantes bacterium]|nr:hypothetical protein [Candidatus Aminicenantes bacterium]